MGVNFYPHVDQAHHFYPHFEPKGFLPKSSIFIRIGIRTWVRDLVEISGVLMTPYYFAS